MVLQSWLLTLRLIVAIGPRWQGYAAITLQQGAPSVPGPTLGDRELVCVCQDVIIEPAEFIVGDALGPR